VPSEAASAAGAAKRARPTPSGVLGLRVALNVFAWWALNVIFNLCNKICLNTWPHPWALATSYWAIGSLCMLPLYLPLPRGPRTSSGRRSWLAVRQLPRLSSKEVASLLPIVALLCIGHATSTLAPAYGTVAFANIIKTAEPLFTCVFSYLLYKRTFSAHTYGSLLLVVCGVALFSTSDVDYSVYTLVAGVTSNAAYAVYSIRAKRALEAIDHLSPRGMYAILTVGGCLALSPVAALFELTGAGASRLAKSTAPSMHGWRLAALLVFTGLMQYLSNEIAFCTLSIIHPVTYAVANTLKRSIVVAVSLLVFGNRLPPLGLAGAAMAIIGAFFYSLSMHAQHAAATPPSTPRRSDADAEAQEDC